MAKKKRTVITLACTPVCYDENGCDVDYAVVSLNKKYAETLLARISLVKGLKHLINNLYHLEEFDYSVDYMKYIEILSETPYRENDEQDIGEEWSDIPITKSLVGESVRVDTPTLVVYNDAVYWKAVVKHTNIIIATSHLTEQHLNKMLKQLGEEDEQTEVLKED